jgi:hypothetical protein
MPAGGAAAGPGTRGTFMFVVGWRCRCSADIETGPPTIIGVDGILLIAVGGER